MGSNSSMRKALEALIEFRDERDWKQFHDPKNLATALSIEASELNEVFLWKTTQDSRNVPIEKVREELADIYGYILLMANEFDLDLEEVLLDKIMINNKKYPVEKAKGNSKKYTEL